MQGYARVRLATFLFALAVVGAMLSPACVNAQTIKKPTLKERLTFGLLARLPSELAFIDAVVEAVNDGKISQRFVDRTFFWARERTPVQSGKFTRRPIIYFQPALEIQLARLGVEIATPRLSFFSRRF